MVVQFSKAVIEWQKQFGRSDLPWQRTPRTPYRVWLSEIMLQQTQVKTVIGYFDRFIDRCPKIEDLADLEEDELMCLWQGLGYYARARNLHQTAKIIVQQHNGVLPTVLEELVKLPGIGESTAAAIISLAYEQPAAILDGNVKRVLTRYFGIEDDISLSKTQKKMWQLAKSILPSTHANIYTQGLMDLGATVCTPKQSSCHLCPFSRTCYAKLNDKVASIPYKTKKVKVKNKVIHVVLHTHDGKVALSKREKGIWQQLYAPSIYDSTAEFSHIQSKLIGEYQHLLTHLRLSIKVYLSKESVIADQWCSQDSITVAIPTGLQKAFELLNATTSG
jgi:A/G-specific adenine glycosylase